MSPKHDTNWPSKDINLNWPPCVLLLIMITLEACYASAVPDPATLRGMVSGWAHMDRTQAWLCMQLAAFLPGCSRPVQSLSCPRD